MQTKIFEVRDRATFIPVMAIAMLGTNDAQARLLKAAGFPSYSPPLITIARLDGGDSNYDPYKWGDRTMHTAHKHIEANFDTLVDGDVIDIEFILGETSTKKVPQ